MLDIVGLSGALIGEHTPFLSAWSKKNHQSSIRPMLPAVTTTVQSTYLTGLWPAETGIVGNGWYDRTDSEIKFWKQSNKLVHGEKVWEAARRKYPGFTCSKMFWWYNMYSSADFSVTPRPQYLSDGRKMPDCYAHPSDLRDRLQQELGTFRFSSSGGRVQILNLPNGSLTPLSLPIAGIIPISPSSTFRIWIIACRNSGTIMLRSDRSCWPSMV